MNAIQQADAAYAAASAIYHAAKDAQDQAHAKANSARQMLALYEAMVAGYANTPKDQALQTVEDRVAQLGQELSPSEQVLYLFEENSIYAAHMWASQREDETGNRPDDDGIWERACLLAENDYLRECVATAQAAAAADAATLARAAEFIAASRALADAILAGVPAGQQLPNDVLHVLQAIQNAEALVAEPPPAV